PPIGVRFLTASPGVLPLGEVTGIEGLDDVRASPGVLAADLYFEVGALIGPLRVDADRRGYVIATADTAEEASVLADAAARKLRVVTRTNAHVLGNVRVLVPVAAVLAAVAAAAAVLVFHGTLHP